MAIFHCAMQIISRGKSKSAVASSAYRSGTKITNEYDGVTHDYTKKGGIFASHILLPTHAPKEYADRSTLWNAVEKIEKAKNSQLAREVEVSIPKEIPSHLWQKMMTDYCNANFVSKGMVADFSIHNKDPSNPHCHIMLTVRPINEDGSWGAKSRKIYDLDENGQRIKLASGNWKSHKEDTTDWNEQSNAELWRANWSEHCNLYLENLGHTERVDHRSYERQGVEKIPTIHMGVSASQMEQKGIRTNRGNINRQIFDDNKQMTILRARISRLMKWQRELKAKPLDLAKADVRTSVMDRLQANNVVVKNQYQSVKELKSNVSIWNFMQAHTIETMSDFVSKISDLNASFYAIKREQNAIKKQVEILDNRLELLREYEQLQPYIVKYKKLKPQEQKTFMVKHGGKLHRYDELQKTLRELTNQENINPNQWQKTRSRLIDDNKLCEWKLKALKEEIGTAEKVQKILEEEKTSIEILKPTKERVTENEL